MCKSRDASRACINICELDSLELKLSVAEEISAVIIKYKRAVPNSKTDRTIDKHNTP